MKTKLSSGYVRQQYLVVRRRHSQDCVECKELGDDVPLSEALADVAEAIGSETLPGDPLLAAHEGQPFVGIRGLLVVPAAVAAVLLVVGGGAILGSGATQPSGRSTPTESRLDGYIVVTPGANGNGLAVAASTLSGGRTVRRLQDTRLDGFPSSRPFLASGDRYLAAVTGNVESGSSPAERSVLIFDLASDTSEAIATIQSDLDWACWGPNSQLAVLNAQPSELSIWQPDGEVTRVPLPGDVRVECAWTSDGGQLLAQRVDLSGRIAESGLVDVRAGSFDVPRVLPQVVSADGLEILDQQGQVLKAIWNDAARRDRVVWSAVGPDGPATVWHDFNAGEGSWIWASFRPGKSGAVALVRDDPLEYRLDTLSGPEAVASSVSVDLADIRAAVGDVDLGEVLQATWGDVLDGLAVSVVDASGGAAGIAVIHPDGTVQMVSSRPDTYFAGFTRVIDE